MFERGALVAALMLAACTGPAPFELEVISTRESSDSGATGDISTRGDEETTPFDAGGDWSSTGDANAPDQSRLSDTFGDVTQDETGKDRTADADGQAGEVGDDSSVDADGGSGPADSSLDSHFPGDGTGSSSSDGAADLGSDVGGADSAWDRHEDVFSADRRRGDVDIVRIYDLAEDLVSYTSCGPATSWCLARAARASHDAQPGPFALDSIRALSISRPLAGEPRIHEWAPTELVPLPWFAQNRASEYVLMLNAISMRPGEVACHPGQQGEYAVAVWTAPAPGAIDIDATFTSNDLVTGTTSDAHVLVRGVEVFYAEIDQRVLAKEYVGAAIVDAGDTVAIAVGRGANNTYESDSTGIQVVIRWTNR
jgi:hypothetical protein